MEDDKVAVSNRRQGYSTLRLYGDEASLKEGHYIKFCKLQNNAFKLSLMITEMNCVVIRTSCFLQFALILKASIKAKDLVYKYQVENGVKIEKRTNK